MGWAILNRPSWTLWNSVPANGAAGARVAQPLPQPRLHHRHDRASAPGQEGLVTQIRDDRAHKYQAAHQREDLVASLMVDVLDSRRRPGSREAALVSFVSQVGAVEGQPHCAAHWTSWPAAQTGATKPTNGRDRGRVRPPVPAARRPVPDWLSRAQWPMRAPRAAMAFVAGYRPRGHLVRVQRRPVQSRPTSCGPTATPVRRRASPSRSSGSAGRCGCFLGGRVRGHCPRGGAPCVHHRRPGRPNHAPAARLTAASSTSSRPSTNRSSPITTAARTYVRRLAVDRPLAYCLPGRNRRVVVTDGTVARLSDDELRAVLAHERAHLRARPTLSPEAFIALQAAFPASCAANLLSVRSRLLAETLADDQAVRSTVRRPWPAPWWPSPAGAPEGRWPSAVR